MSYQVLARKWRPKDFAALAGQEHVVRALMNALEQQRLHHAYLFTGTRGVGKTTIARIIAKCLNCETGITATPCGQCSACTAIDAGRFMDLIEVDAASRTKVEDTRELLENVQYAPSSGRFKIYLIDEVHMLSSHSFNALLKTLEEPPPHVKFLLATTDPQKLPITILSRCLQFNLKRLPIAMITEHLQKILQQENVTADMAALQRIARAADGSMRDAQSLLDQAIAYGNGAVQRSDVEQMLGDVPREYVYDLLQALADQQPAAVLDIIAKLSETISDFNSVLAELIASLHALAKLQLLPQLVIDDLIDAERLQALAACISKEDVQLYYQIALHGRRDLPLAYDPRSGFEMVLLRMLAFRPQESTLEPNQNRLPPVKSTTTSAAVTKPAAQPVVAPISSPSSPAIAAPLSAAAESSAQQTAPAPVIEAGAAISTQSLTSDDWPLLIQRCGLKGLTQQLAANSELQAAKAGEINLRLHADHAHLRSPAVEKRLSEALSHVFGESIQLNIEVGKTSTETPAERDQRQQDERQQQARDAIARDPFVQALQTSFDAKVVVDSIRPTD